jgi:hypothetical protein
MYHIKHCNIKRYLSVPLWLIIVELLSAVNTHNVCKQ